VKQAPNWNAAVKEFAANDHLVFADVNLRDASIRGAPHNPGAGGWPTVRYFNAETGYDGKNYEKKTSQAMCDELGPKNKYLQEFIEDLAPKCFVDNPESGCNEKEQKFIAKFKEKSADDVTAQITRLTGMAGGKMKPALKTWLNQRLHILKQFSAGGDKPAAGHEEL